MRKTDDAVLARCRDNMDRIWHELMFLPGKKSLPWDAMSNLMAAEMMLWRAIVACNSTKRGE